MASRRHLVFRIGTLLCVCALLCGANVSAQVETNAATVLPNGRRVTPVGGTVQLAPFPFTMAVRPDGKQIVAASIGWPFSLNVIDDPGTPKVRVRRIPPGSKNDPEVQVHTGIVYSPDGKLLYDATGNSGAVDVYSTAAWKRVKRIPLDGILGGVKFGSSFSASVALDASGKRLYLLDQGNWRVVVVDTEAAKIVASSPTGVNPFAIALSPDGRHLYVTNSGLFEYRLAGNRDANDRIGSGLHFPPFGYPSKAARDGARSEGYAVPGLGDENDSRGSSLWTYDLSDARAPRVSAKLRLGEKITEKPRGVIGGASPSGLAADGAHVYVALAHEDSVAVVSTDGARLESQIALSPFHGGEFQDRSGRPLRGVAPQEVAVGKSRLYVAESGINSVAVIDTDAGKVIGHVPSGWYPAAVSVSPDTKLLYVLNNKGKGAGPSIVDGHRHYIGELEYGSLSAVPLSNIEDRMAGNTAAVVQNNETALAHSSRLPKLPIHHVFLIIRENRTFDEIFGDLAGADGAPKLARYGVHGWAEENPALHDLKVTPNAHALAARFATSDRWSTDSDVSVDGHHWAVGAAPTPWLNIAWTSGYGGRRDENAAGTAPGRRAMGGGADSTMPEDEPEFGSLWEHVADAKLPLLNYGEGLEIEGSDEKPGTEPQGHRLYLNAPLPNPVFTSTDRLYPTFNLGIPDQFRFTEFERDFNKRIDSGFSPALTVIRLPNDHTAEPRPGDGYPYRASYVADNDLALGKIMDLISHSRLWKDSATFVIEDDAQNGVDHVDAHRSVLLVISPYVRQGVISHVPTSMVSVQRTIYALLGVGPLNLEDALSGSLADIFDSKPDFTPYQVLPSDLRVFNPAAAKLARPRNAKEAHALLDCDDPREMRAAFQKKQRRHTPGVESELPPM